MEKRKAPYSKIHWLTLYQKTYGYDANGNLTNDGRLAYFWDDENRLIVVRDAKTGALIQENRYDGLGRRREMVEHGDEGPSTNRYLYQNWLVLAVADGSGNVLETYTHGADLSGQVGGGAGGIGGILASTQANEMAFYHYDFNGNVVQVSGSNQTQLAKYTYSPFGEVLLKEGKFNSRYQFSTKELDGSTGMNYYGYRFYSPGLGRFLNRDPVEELGGLNLYGYLINDPLNAYDVLGLKRVPYLFIAFYQDACLPVASISPGQLPKVLKWIYKIISTASLIEGLQGDLVAQVTEYMDVPDCYVVIDDEARDEWDVDDWEFRGSEDPFTVIQVCFEYHHTIEWEWGPDPDDPCCE